VLTHYHLKKKKRFQVCVERYQTQAIGWFSCYSLYMIVKSTLGACKHAWKAALSFLLQRSWLDTVFESFLRMGAYPEVQ
jgi:hypothetical protein